MSYKENNRYQRRHKKKRSFIGRFFIILGRMIKLPIEAAVRAATGGSRKQDWVKFFTVVLLIFVVAGGLIGFSTVAFFNKDLPDPTKIYDRVYAESTKIYDRTGEHLLYEISGDQRRTVVKLEDLPSYIPQSIIALEDKTFYKHNGFNYQRIAKAILYAIMGRKGPGASTLTSQFVKNAVLSPERKLSRKIKEFILVFKIERIFEKDEILQLYLNEIPWGGTAYGVESAANLYYDKSAVDLSLPEAAFLAAIIQKPTKFSPFGNNVQAALDRKDLTLRLMAEQGYITEEEKEEAQAVELSFATRREDITAPHFVFHVREQLVDLYDENTVNQGGLIVKTTLDLDKQTIAEEVLAEQREANQGYQASNAAMVSLDPKTGEILAMVGSYDYFDDEIDGQVNVTTRPRQPGSSLKPMVYTAAWQRGYTPSSILFDVVTQFPGSGKTYEPKNYDLSERGPVSLRKALQGSLNIPAVKLLYLIGVNNFIDFAENLGYSTFGERDRFGLSLVLGGGEVTLLEHTAAYATLANDGEYHEPLAILEIQNRDGDVLEEFEADSHRAIEENISRITTNVLSDNGARAYVFGAGSPLQLGSRPAAAKTGTTNDYRDAWTMGYTPSLATGVWAGNNDFSEMNRGAGGSTLAAPIWHNFMVRALEGTEIESFPSAKIPQPDKAVLSGQGFGTKLVAIDRASGKLATDLTPDSFREDRLYIEAHSILHYVDKSNPTGPPPANPGATDPQYDKWESAVQGWIQARIDNNEPIFDDEQTNALPEGVIIEYGLPPEEEDDLHIEANTPSVSISSPNNDEELEARTITVQVNANAPRGVSRVEYYFDDIFIGQSASAPFSLSTSLKSFPNGFYTLRAIAFDDIDNSKEASIKLKLQSDESYVKVRWVQPDSGSEFELNSEPIALRLDVDSPEQLNQITFFAEQGNEQEIIEALINPGNGTFEVPWTPAETGNYRIYTKISINNSGVLTSPSLNIAIKEPPKVEEEEES